MNTHNLWGDLLGETNCRDRNSCRVGEQVSVQRVVNGSVPAYPLVLAGEGEVVKIVLLHGGHRFRERLLSMGIDLEDEVTVVHRQGNGAVVIEKAGSRYGLGGGMAHKIQVIKV